MPISYPSGLYERIAILNEVVVLLLGQPEHSGDDNGKGQTFLEGFRTDFRYGRHRFQLLSLLWTAYLIRRDRGFCNGRSLILKLTRGCIPHVDLEVVL